MVSNFGQWRPCKPAIDDSLVSWHEIKDQFVKDGGILIGNGFSQAVWRKFGYSSLYETASSEEYTNHPLAFDDKRLFEEYGTKNFEMVLSLVSNASKTNRIAGLPYLPLEERYEHIKTALGEAVRAVHVPWERIRFTGDVLQTIRAELKNYQFVYSTNYDLLPYWAIMSAGDVKEFKDYFWGQEASSGADADSYFDIANSRIYGSPTRILYLHGALLLYRDPRTGRTHKFRNSPNGSLLDITSQIPLFITEGSSEDKLKAIRTSDYLQFAYNQFVHHSGNLVIFGHSLGESDQHLIDAIRQASRSRGIRKIAISMMPSHTADEKMERKAYLRRALHEGLWPEQKPDLIFFDSQTHPLGSEDVRVEEEVPFDYSVFAF